MRLLGRCATLSKFGSCFHAGESCNISVYIYTRARSLIMSAKSSVRVRGKAIRAAGYGMEREWRKLPDNNMYLAWPTASERLTIVTLCSECGKVNKRSCCRGTRSFAIPIFVIIILLWRWFGGMRDENWAKRCVGLSSIGVILRRKV